MLSRWSRKKYNLPLKGPSGLTFEQELDIRKEDSQIGLKRGLNAEKQFLAAWADKSLYHRAIKSVRQATKEEDLREKTDAVVTLTNEDVFRIQIKCRRNFRSRGINALRQLNIILLNVLPEHTDETIRNNTIQALREFVAYKSSQHRPTEDKH